VIGKDKVKKKKERKLKKLFNLMANMIQSLFKVNLYSKLVIVTHDEI